MLVLDLKNRLFMFFISFFLLCAVLLSCPGCKRDTSPPDLSNCTRFEIRYPRSTLDYFLCSTGIQESILSTEEKEYIQSIEFFTVNDPDRIKAFAHDVSLGTYGGNMRGVFTELRISEGRPVNVDCYRNDEHIISFMVCTNWIITEDRRIFKYPRGLPNLEIIEPEEMQPYKLRFQCALNMQTIYTAGPFRRRKAVSYPECTKWCDITIKERASYVTEQRMVRHLACPAADKGKCNYAMNPNCEPDSPGNMVLLFETKAGWNQHGGPELFTFDNHNPKGGCVLLNDGTVKFIRTKEELHKLRWK